MHDACDVLQLTHLSTGAKMHVLALTHEFPQIFNTCMLAVARPACQPCTGGSTSKPGRGKHMLALALASCQLSTWQALGVARTGAASDSAACDPCMGPTRDQGGTGVKERVLE